jgi:hypothetical protein
MRLLEGDRLSRADGAVARGERYGSLRANGRRGIDSAALRHGWLGARVVWRRCPASLLLPATANSSIRRNAPNDMSRPLGSPLPVQHACLYGVCCMTGHKGRNLSSTPGDGLLFHVLQDNDSAGKTAAGAEVVGSVDRGASDAGWPSPRDSSTVPWAGRASRPATPACSSELPQLASTRAAPHTLKTNAFSGRRLHATCPSLRIKWRFLLRLSRTIPRVHNYSLLNVARIPAIVHLASSHRAANVDNFPGKSLYRYIYIPAILHSMPLRCAVHS